MKKIDIINEEILENTRQISILNNKLNFYGGLIIIQIIISTICILKYCGK